MAGRLAAWSVPTYQPSGFHGSDMTSEAARSIRERAITLLMQSTIRELNRMVNEQLILEVIMQNLSYGKSTAKGIYNENILKYDGDSDQERPRPSQPPQLSYMLFHLQKLSISLHHLQLPLLLKGAVFLVSVWLCMILGIIRMRNSTQS